MTPFFSVVIPLYNKETFIEETVKSVLDQTFHDFEIIIVNDGSTDKSLEKLSDFNDNRIKIFTQSNKGAATARNTGIKNAKAEYIALLDADDTWYKNHLEELYKQIQSFPYAGLYCNNYEVYYTKNLKRKASFNFDYNDACLLVEDYFKASIINSVAWTSSVCFTKTHFNALGGFNEKLKTAQDLDLWIRFALKHKISFNPKITMSYKKYVKNSLSKDEYNAIRYDFVNSYAEEAKTNPSLKKYLDINRYAIALRSKLNGDTLIYKKLKKEIDFENLNKKQKFLMKLPVFLLKIFKKIHSFLSNNNFYTSSYS